MRLQRILIVAGGVLLVINVAAVVALQSIDFNKYKSLVAELDLKVDRLVLPNKLPVVTGDGIASTEKGIAFETSRMTLVSSGAANLKGEIIDFSLRPEATQVAGIGAGELVKLLRVRGTLAEPKFGLDEIETAKTAASAPSAKAPAGQEVPNRRAVSGSSSGARSASDPLWR